MRKRCPLPIAGLVVALPLLTACLDAHEAPSVAPASAASDPYDSGGALIPEQAAYDVTFYDLSLAVSPSDSSIRGRLAMTARVLAPVRRIAVDLDPLLAIESVRLHQPEARFSLSFERAGGRVFVELPRTAQPGGEL